MAEKPPRKNENKQKSSGVTFICQECQRTWNIGEMRRITRFRPVLVVCPECEVGMV